MNGQNDVQVAQALKSLSMRVVQAHHPPMGVMRHLAGDKELIAYALSVLILSRRRQTGGAFSFVHGRDA